MAGNSSRRGARKKGVSKTVGSGGRIRGSLEGRGPTPKASDRPYHKAYRAKRDAEFRARTKTKADARSKPKPTGADWVIGRNPVLEALRAGVPVRSAFVAEGAERDHRLRDILRHAAEHSIPLQQAPRAELDRLTGGLVHQGVALQLPPFEYADVDDLLEAGLADEAGLVVALDQVTDPRNLGAIIRSAAAFAATGVLIPSRRSATVTAAAWKTSAGAAARVPVGMATNLNRALARFAEEGFTIIGLDGDAEETIADVDSSGPIVLVVGSEDEGLSRLVRERCDHLAAIPISGAVESLNASVACSVALYELRRAVGIDW